MKDKLQWLLELCFQIEESRGFQEPGGWYHLLGEMDALREIHSIMEELRAQAATNTSNFTKVIDINQIDVSPDRRRVEIDDARKMAESIREHGLIQPIVLAKTTNNNHGVGDRYQLVAGGHRLAAIRIMGWQYLTHFEHYVLRGEDSTTDEGKLRLAAVELEENLRRKELTWSEQIEQKQKLYELMVSIHGKSNSGPKTIKERATTNETSGFGVRKLAAMLGESIGTVSQDLQLAKMVRAIPTLAKEDSKSSASRKGTIQIALHAIKTGQAAKPQQPTVQPLQSAQLPQVSGTGEGAAAATLAPVVQVPKFNLFEGRWEDGIIGIPDASIDLVYTDLPYGVNLSQMSAHTKGAVTYSDNRDDVVGMLPRLCNQAYRVLRDARYAVFWFGFNYYSELIHAISHAGFDYNPVPFIWLKHRQSTENPLSRYANAYEQAIIAWKGSAKFIRPGQTNIADIPGVSVGAKIQNAQQPVALVERFIRDMLLVDTGARVLDFCAGSGTTGVAALLNGCFPILFERDSDQCLIIKQRLENAQGNSAKA